MIDQAGEAAVEQHEAADVGLEAGLGDALDHAGVMNLAARCLGQDLVTELHRLISRSSVPYAMGLPCVLMIVVEPPVELWAYV
jgi:hypothetical protein